MQSNCDISAVACRAGATMADRLLGAVAWGETFVWLGLHIPWILGKSTPLSAENNWGMLLAAAPFAVMLLAALLIQIPRCRQAMISIEWLLHLTGAAIFLKLLVFLMLRDPLSPILPQSWPFAVWGIGLTFLLLANLAGHERRRIAYGSSADGGFTNWRLLPLGILVWGVTLWVASTMTWPAYFWTVSIVLHAVVAPLGIAAAKARADVPPRDVRPTTRLAAGSEGLFLVAMLFIGLMRVTFADYQTGTYELKYLDFLGLYVAPLFFAGVALLYIGALLRATPLTHALVAGVLVFTAKEVDWPIALSLGYGLAALFRANGRQGAVAYALGAALVSGAWLLGMMGFSLSGLIVFYGNNVGFVEFLLHWARVVVAALFAVWFMLWVLELSKAELWPARDASPRTASTALATVVYIVLLVLAFAPAAVLIPLKLSPPLVITPPQRLDVGDMMGVCHAGYSKDDAEYAQLHKLGVRMMRVDFHWAGVQTAPDAWDFSQWDSYLDAAERHEVRVLAVLAFDNNAVETSKEGKEKDKYVAPEDVPLFLEYVRQVVTRYKDRVYAWEFWNEADIPRFWQGSSEEFYAFARQVGQTLHDIDPNLRTVGTAMTGSLCSWTPEQVEGIHASGAMERFDHPAMHCYVSDPRTYYYKIQKVVLAARKHGHQGSVWITELGDPDGGVYPWRVSSELLAEHAMKSYTIASALGIEELVWYCMRDSDPGSQMKDPKESERFFGLVTADYEWKPAAYAYNLFSTWCTNSVLRRDLVDVSGCVGGRELRAVMYRRANNDSALVMWLEPTLRQGARARVRIDLGETAEPPVVRDIGSAYTKMLLDDVVDVDEHPLFITFTAASPDQPVALDVSTSPIDRIWPAGLVGALLVSFVASVRQKRVRPAAEAGPAAL